jgi:hypothetical protein
VERPAAEDPTAVAPADSVPPLVARLMFIPVHLASRRLLAPRLSAQLFASVWRVVDHSDPPPRPDEQQRSVTRLAVALALDGACTAVVRGLLEQGSRRQIARLTGRWPTQPPKR